MPTECWCVRRHFRPHAHFTALCPASPVTGDWTDLQRVPRGYGGHGGPYGDRLAPEFIQANLFSLSRIGSVYDYIALAVEKDHAEILAAWRLDSGAPHVLDYLASRGHTPESMTTQKREANAQSERPPDYLTGSPGGHR